MVVKIIDQKIDFSDQETEEKEARNVVTAMVRSTRFTESEDVKSIFFETYEDMARDLMEKIKRDAIERFHVSGVTITQRVGQIPVGEYTFLVAVSARRIDDAFSACKFVVEEMNSELPIWKYEVKGR